MVMYECTSISQCPGHCFRTVLHHRADTVRQRIGQDIGDPDNAAALVVRKHLRGGMVIAEAALDDGVGDASRRFVVTKQPLACHETIGEGKNPVITVGRSRGEEAGCDPLMHGMEIAERVPDLFWSGRDEEFLDDRSHDVCSFLISVKGSTYSKWLAATALS